MNRGFATGNQKKLIDKTPLCFPAEAQCLFMVCPGKTPGFISFPACACPSNGPSLSSNSQSLFFAFCSPQYKCLIAVFPELLLGIFAFFRPSSLRSSLGKGGSSAGREAGGDTGDKDSPGTCSLRLWVQSYPQGLFS